MSQIRNIGFAPPPSRSCTDQKCPFHGTLSVRGRIFEGTVVSDKMTRTVTVERGFLAGSKKYKRYERKFTKFDNRTFFTRPWDNFCIPTAPTCQKDFLEKKGMLGVFPIGCNCEKTGISKSPPAIPDSCYDIDHSYYYK